MACARCGGFLVIEDCEGELVNYVRDGQLRTIGYARCVNCGCIDDPVIHENRLIERSSTCCTTR